MVAPIRFSNMNYDTSAPVWRCPAVVDVGRSFLELHLTSNWPSPLDSCLRRSQVWRMTEGLDKKDNLGLGIWVSPDKSSVSLGRGHTLARGASWWSRRCTPTSPCPRSFCQRGRALPLGCSRWRPGWWGRPQQWPLRQSLAWERLNIEWKASSPGSPENWVVGVPKVSLACPPWSYPQQWPVPERLKIGAKGALKFSLEEIDTALSGAWEEVEVLSHWIQTRDLHQTPVDLSIGKVCGFARFEIWKMMRKDMKNTLITYQQHWKCIGLFQARPPRLWHNSQPAQPAGEKFIRQIWFDLQHQPVLTPW